MARKLIEVRIDESNAIRITRSQYSYVEFEELSEDLRPGDSVTYTLNRGKKIIYQGVFVKVPDLSVHEHMHQRIHDMIKKGSIKEKQGLKLLDELDKEFEIPDGKNPVHSNSVFSNPKQNQFSQVLEKIKDINLLKFWKKWLIGIAACFLLLLTVVFVSQSFTKADRPESYQTLVDEKEYVTALKNYPEEETNLVEELYSKKNQAALHELYQEGKSNLAHFYELFLEKKWEKVTELEELPLNTTVQGMLGYAYLQQGKIEEAELINKEIDSKVLTKQIKLAKKDEAYRAISEKNIDKAEEINKEIKDDQLKEDISVAKSIINLLKKYQSDKDNKELSDSERKEATENMSLWEDKLKQLGGSKDEKQSNE